MYHKQLGDKDSKAPIIMYLLGIGNSNHLNSSSIHYIHILAFHIIPSKLLQLSLIKNDFYNFKILNRNLSVIDNVKIWELLCSVNGNVT